MTAPQFTPAPWRIDGLSLRDGWGAHEGEDSIEIACLPHDAFDALEIYGKRRDHDDYDEFSANARLIAAAPELYDGCNAMLGLAQLLLGRDDLPAEVREALTTSHRIQDAGAAVAKARGGQ